MRFTLTGTLHGLNRPASVTWEDGHLSGDQDAVDSAQRWAHYLEGEPVGLAEHPPTHYLHLWDHGSALALLQHYVFAGVPTYQGDPAPLAPGGGVQTS